MTDIVLVQVPPWGLFAPPLGIAYLSSYLKEKGFNVEAVDMNIILYNLALDKNLWNFERKDEWNDGGSFSRIRDILDKDIDYCIKRILSDDPLAVGLSVNQNSILFTLELAKRIKLAKNKTVIIAGGWGCYNKHERDILRQESLIDAFIIGEGEESLYELMDSFKKRGKIEDIKGVLLKQEDDLSFSPRLPIKNLDKVPFPTYEEFELNDYQSSILCMLSSRGCIGRCAFCNDRVYQGEIRYREPEKIVQEMEYHIQKNNINNFSFNDLLINGNLKHLNSWCDLIIKRKLKINWLAQALPRPDMDLSLLYKMKEAGCDTLQFGIESGSNKILKKMRKMFNVDDAERVLIFTRKAGIKTWINLIVGFPDEQEEDFSETINFIRRNRENIDRVSSVNTCNVVFNSYLMNHRENYGIILSDRPEFLELSWYTSDGNCNELRKERASRLVSILRKLELPIGQNNLFLLSA